MGKASLTKNLILFHICRLITRVSLLAASEAVQTEKTSGQRRGEELRLEAERGDLGDKSLCSGHPAGRRDSSKRPNRAETSLRASNFHITQKTITILASDTFGCPSVDAGRLGEPLRTSSAELKRQITPSRRRRRDFHLSENPDVIVGRIDGSHGRIASTRSRLEPYPIITHVSEAFTEILYFPTLSSRRGL